MGLQPYSEEESEYFFGREREGVIISSNLYAAPLTVLYGASGVGKSSVLRAAVVPQLRREPRTAVVYFNSWQNSSFAARLKSACLASVEKVLGRASPVDSTERLDVFISSLAAHFHGTLLILLDQFEEYFLYNPHSESEAFEDELSAAIHGSNETAFLISVRDDWLARLDRFQDRVPNLLSNMLRLDHLNRGDAEEAIRKPLQVYNRRRPSGSSNIGIEDGLVVAVLDEVRAGIVNMSGQSGAGQLRDTRPGDRIETAYLQLVLERLWEEERAAESNILRLETYRRLGGASRIVQTHLDRVMNELPAGSLESCARMFQYLVTPSGVKIAHETADLVSFSGRPEPEVKSVLEDLTAKRVLRRVSQPERYEIFHDVLAPAILDWRARRIQSVLEQEALIQRRAARRFRWLSLALGVMALIAGLVALYAWKKATDATNFRAALNLSNKNLSDAQLLYAQKDYKGAKALLERLSNAGNSKAMTLLGQLYEFGYGEKQDFTAARRWYEDGARLGDPNSMYNLALLYQNGRGVAEDAATARDWFKMAAATGHVASMYYLGVLYATGAKTVPQDYAEALDWFQKAAVQDHASAMYNLGILYSNGLGVPQDYKIALGWYEKAADLGHASAMYNVGLFHSEGLGVPQNYETALRWYERAADSGHAESMYAIGLLYSSGSGVKQDYTTANGWYEKASDLGHASAMCALGYSYENGRGVERNYPKARQWYERSATFGNASAMYQLGQLYAKGDGTPINYAVAREWYRKAIKAGYPAAEQALEAITGR